MYYNVHTHTPSREQDTCSVVNIIPIEGLLPAISPEGYYSIGLHPWEISPDHWKQSFERLSSEVGKPFIKAIGECGLDKVCDTPFDLQQLVFEAQIVESEKHGKPLIIHCVKAFDEIIAYRKKHKPREAWIIHGFRGNPQQAGQLVRQGFYLSFGMLYNEDTIRQVPLEYMFLETDDSEHAIREVYEKVSETLGLSKITLIKQIAFNFEKVFSLSN